MTDEKPPLDLGRSMYLITWLLAFFLFFLFFYYYKNATPPEYSVKGGLLSIPVDNSGHFRIKGSINGQEIIFLIDTGATIVGIPQNIANDLQLPSLYPITMKTAAGEVSGSLTRLNQLQFGNFTLNNVKAAIVADTASQEVLLGMNVLSDFVILQENNQLIIKTKKH